MLELFSQYGLVILAIVFVVGVKYFTLRSKTNRELKTYAHPSVFLEEIKKKVPTTNQAEQILIINLEKL